MSVIRWGLSMLDWQRHAVDIGRNHPVGVFVAQCGHLLMLVTPLEVVCAGSLCPGCGDLPASGKPDKALDEHIPSREDH